VESLSILLLRLRDGKTRGLKKKGVLAQIVKGKGEFCFFLLSFSNFYHYNV
jgi:hypothetical protein